MAKAKKKGPETTPASPPAPPPGTGKTKSAGAGGAKPPVGTDLLSQCVMLCQTQRWREAALLCRRVQNRAASDGNEDLVQSLAGARTKIDFSLRRQMTAAAVIAVRQLLAKEFLLDVGE